MSVQSITPHTKKGRALNELQRMRSKVVDGGAAGANLTATGLKTVDTLVSVIMFAAGVPSDVTSDASITANDVLVLATTNSTGNKLVVHYWAKPTE